MFGGEELREEIARLLLILRKLSRRSGNDWVNWPDLAREVHGNVTTGDPLVRGVAALPDCSDLLRQNDRVVRLTPEGLRWLQDYESGNENTNPLAQVAEAVKTYASQLGWISYDVSAATLVKKVGGRDGRREKFVYLLSIDLGDDPITTDTPVLFESRNHRRTEGKIVGHDAANERLFAAFVGELLGEDFPGRLKIEKGALVSQLGERLQQMSLWPERFRSLVDPQNVKHEKPLTSEDSGEMADRLAAMPAPWTRMLWGPPGAGKTFAIARLALHVTRQDPTTRTLIVAPSNRAADTIAVELMRQCRAESSELMRERRLLRYGYPRLSEVIESPELLGPENAEELSARVRASSRELACAEREKKDEAEIAGLRAELLAAQEALRETVAAHLQQARIVVSTTTQAFLKTSPISGERWNTVIVDEVTMVPPALCLFLSSLATDRLLLAGDPQQLGPVFEACQTDKTEIKRWLNAIVWMGQDIFVKSQLSAWSDDGLLRTICMEDPRLCRIRAQRRCAEGIWGQVRSLYPDVARQTDERRLAATAELPPHAGKSLVVMDLSESPDAVCEKVGRSWKNTFSADRAMEVALTIAAEASEPISIAIVTPYRGQVRLLQRLIRDELTAQTCPLQSKRVRLEAGTIHQFQGSEADVVIFDMVDGRGRGSVGKLLEGDAGLRLVNVAVTRAKGKLVVLADREWCGNQLRVDNPLLHRIVLGDELSLRVQVIPPAGDGSRVKSTAHAVAQPDAGAVEDGRSPIEERFHQALKRHPLLAACFCEQVRIRDERGQVVSRADFAIEPLRYAVYCDGRQWHAVEGKWQSDLRKRNMLTQLGWTYSVFSGRDINSDADECLKQVIATLHSKIVPMLKEGDLLKRQSWEMTISEWQRFVGILTAAKDENLLRDIGGMTGDVYAHQARVENALREGKHVPEHVLQEYPNLQRPPVRQA